jgi:membrane-associated phospholipid phosphatase
VLLRARNAFIGAGVGVVLLVLTWVLAFHVGPFKSADQEIFKGFYNLHDHGVIPRIANHVADLCDPRPFFFLAAIPVVVALVRRRWRLALTIGVILLAASCTTELLKPLLATAHPSELLGGENPVTGSTWPSGHATAAMSLALTCVLAVPRRLRPKVAALGAVFAIAVCYSFLTLGWHYPSDVLGGFLVAATWTLLGVGALLLSDPRTRGRASEEAAEPVSVQAALAPVAATLAAAAALACLIVLVRPHEVVNYAQSHTVFVVGAAAIGAAAVALATGVMLAVSGSGRAPTAARRHRWRPGSG